MRGSWRADGLQGRSSGSARPRAFSSVINVERKRRDHHSLCLRLEHRLQQPPALVVQDLMAALAGDDLGDQDSDRRVLGLNRLNIVEHGAYELSLIHISEPTRRTPI